MFEASSINADVTQPYCRAFETNNVHLPSSYFFDYKQILAKSSNEAITILVLLSLLICL